jgi:hypothetical protein
MLDNAEDKMRLYGISYKNEVIWIFFAALLVFTALFVLGFLVGSPWLLRFAMLLSGGLLLALLLLATIFMIVMVRRKPKFPIPSLTSPLSLPPSLPVHVRSAGLIFA